MITLKCPKCQEELIINLAQAVDEDGEVFLCPKCKHEFRYAPNG